MNKSPIATILLALILIAADRPPTCPHGRTGSDCLPWRPPFPRVEPKERDTLPSFILPVTGGQIYGVQIRRRR